jgi:hypothetical protein
MTDESEIERLTQLFRRLGARDPAKWARSQVLDGIPQLARFVFLRQAWRNVVPADDASWIDARLAPSVDLGVGEALQALMARGATPRELTNLVRGMQTELLLGMCQLLEDPGDLEPEVADIGWVLVQVADDGSPVDAIGGLPEIVLETDPARELGQPVMPASAAAPADEAPDAADAEAEAPEPTCGEELAQSAEIPDAVAVLMQHVALNLHAHANWVGRASEAARNEHAAMLKVAAAYEDLAASAQRAAQTMRSFEHLPPAPHDAQQRDLPAFIAWMRTKITLQYELANLLAAHATESEGVLEQVSGQ